MTDIFSLDDLDKLFGDITEPQPNDIQHINNGKYSAGISDEQPPAENEIIEEALAVWVKRGSEGVKLLQWNDAFHQITGGIFAKGTSCEMIFDSNLAQMLDGPVVVSGTAIPRYPMSSFGYVMTKMGIVCIYACIDVHVKSYLDRANASTTYRVTRFLAAS